MVLMGFAAVALACGCASTQVTRQEPLVREHLPRPSQILVVDFVATAADVPADSAIAREFEVADVPQTPEQIQDGRELGAELAETLASKIRDMGLPALRSRPGSKARVNDLVIRGFLVSIDEGSAAKRVGIGFGAGASELHTVVEGYQVTATGLRKLGSGKVESGGAKTPGAALGAATLIATANPVGLIVSGGMKVYGEKSGKSKLEGRAEATAQEIADVFRLRFQEQGWID
ncbi:MAG TPA: hypothetical protein DCM68_05775 [Verrucomicrobia bacterium]|nr:hypothetical protein [Verrucomicrobiota bacterium]